MNDFSWGHKLSWLISQSIQHIQGNRCVITSFLARRVSWLGYVRWMIICSPWTLLQKYYAFLFRLLTATVWSCIFNTSLLHSSGWNSVHVAAFRNTRPASSHTSMCVWCVCVRVCVPGFDVKKKNAQGSPPRSYTAGQPHPFSWRKMKSTCAETIIFYRLSSPLHLSSLKTRGDERHSALLGKSSRWCSASSSEPVSLAAESL